MGQTCLYLVHQLLLRISVLLMVPALISTKWLITHMTHNSKRFEIFWYHSCRDSKRQTLKTICKAVGIVTSRITDAELIVNTLSAKMALFAETEQNVSALSQNVYFSFHVNNSMLECLLGSINFSQRLTFPQPTGPSRFIVKQDLDLPSLYLRQEPSVENSWYVSRMMVFSVSIMVRQSKSQDDREIGKLFAPLWNVLSKNLQELFPESGIEDTFIVPSLDVRAHVPNIYDRRNGVGKRVFKLAPPGHDQMFATTAPRVCKPHISDDEL